MRTECRAIVQSEYGAPEKVLRIVKRPLKSEELGVDDALIKVIARPIHPGDIQILSALPQGGPVAPIPEGALRLKAQGSFRHWSGAGVRKMSRSTSQT